jgi:elongation factor G
MKVYDAASIRNVAIVGHSGSGKTQLVSAILSDAGMVNRFGKVDEGTTVTDFDEEEIARKHTLSASLAYAEWNKQKINLIDTPGVGNFLSDARAVTDAAVRWSTPSPGRWSRPKSVGAAGARPARMVVLNRLDRGRSSLSRSLDALREACNRWSFRFSCPSAKIVQGIVDLVTKKAFIFQTDGSGKSTRRHSRKHDHAVAKAREALIEWLPVMRK